MLQPSSLSRSALGMRANFRSWRKPELSAAEPRSGRVVTDDGPETWDVLRGSAGPET